MGLWRKKKRINEKNPAPRVFICITFHTRLKIISDSLSVRLLENTNHWACREYKMINFFSLTRFWSRATGFVTSLLYGPVLQKEHVKGRHCPIRGKSWRYIRLVMKWTQLSTSSSFQNVNKVKITRVIGLSCWN